MNKETSARKSNLGIQWVKSSESGNTYLCPIGFFADGKNRSEEDLKRYCVDESSNPQND